MPAKTVSSRWRIDRFLAEMASSRPVPGGGSAAALVGAIGCALGCKVCRILLARSVLRASARSRIWRDLRRLEVLSRKLNALIQQDSTAYLRLVRATRSGRGIEIARRGAIRAPQAIHRAASQALKIFAGLSGLAGPHLGSDLKAGRALLKAAREAAEAMVG